MIRTVVCRRLKDPAGGRVEYHWFKTQGPPVLMENVTSEPHMHFAPIRETNYKVEYRFLVVGTDGDLANPNPQHVSLNVLQENT